MVLLIISPVVAAVVRPNEELELSRVGSISLTFQVVASHLATVVVGWKLHSNCLVLSAQSVRVETQVLALENQHIIHLKDDVADLTFPTP